MEDKFSVCLDPRLYENMNYFRRKVINRTDYFNLILNC